MPAFQHTCVTLQTLLNVHSALLRDIPALAEDECAMNRSVSLFTGLKTELSNHLPFWLRDS